MWFDVVSDSSVGGPADAARSRHGTPPWWTAVPESTAAAAGGALAPGGSQGSIC
jgi:hypothetical protein